jgi:hypothetical protein
VATETIRPTDAYNPGSFDDPTLGYNGNTADAATQSSTNATPGISFGGDIVSESTNDWASKAQTWTSASIYVWFGLTIASNDTVELLVTDQNGTLKHTLVASTSDAVTKAEFNAALSSGDWGGAGFPDIANIRVRCNGNKAAQPDNAVASIYDVRIEGEYTLVEDHSFDPAVSDLPLAGLIPTAAYTDHRDITPAVSDLPLAGLIPTADYTAVGGEVIFLNQMDEISQQTRIQTAAKLGGVLIE